MNDQMGHFENFYMKVKFYVQPFSVSSWSQTKEYLARNAKDRAEKSGVSLTSHSHVIAQLPAPGTKITMQDFTEVRTSHRCQITLPGSKELSWPSQHLTHSNLTLRINSKYEIFFSAERHIV